MTKPWAGRTTKPKKGIHEYTYQMRAVRPKHAKGIQFEPEWFEHCDSAFQAAMRKELWCREKEKSLT